MAVVWENILKLSAHPNGEQRPPRKTLFSLFLLDNIVSRLTES